MDAHWPLQKKLGAWGAWLLRQRVARAHLFVNPVSHVGCLRHWIRANQTGAGVGTVNLHFPKYSNRCSLSTPCRIEIIWKTCISNMKWLELDQSKKSVYCEWHSDASDNRDSPESFFAKAARAWLALGRSPVRVRNDERWRIYSNHIDWMGKLMWQFFSCGKWSRENICNMSSHCLYVCRIFRISCRR